MKLLLVAGKKKRGNQPSSEESQENQGQDFSQNVPHLDTLEEESEIPQQQPIAGASGTSYTIARSTVGQSNAELTQGFWNMGTNERTQEFGSYLAPFNEDLAHGSLNVAIQVPFERRQDLETITRQDQPSMLEYAESRIAIMPTALHDKMMSEISVACKMDFFESMTETLVPPDLLAGLHEFFMSDQTISKEFILCNLGMLKCMKDVLRNISVKFSLFVFQFHGSTLQ